MFKFTKKKIDELVQIAWIESGMERMRPKLEAARAQVAYERKRREEAYKRVAVLEVDLARVKQRIAQNKKQTSETEPDSSHHLACATEAEARGCCQNQVLPRAGS
ncbi:MAG: hypothetical protein IJV20_10390 [Prevotella sp.]|nr:hypothetical protein [Prevotella sp.]